MAMGGGGGHNRSEEIKVKSEKLSLPLWPWEGGTSVPEEAHKIQEE